jgi:hypothetical protein
VNEIFAEKLAETAVQGLTALAEVATAPANEPLDWPTKLAAIRLIVESAIPPGVFPAPTPFEDPRKAVMYEIVRRVDPDKWQELGHMAAERLASMADASPAASGSTSPNGH